MLRQQGDDHRRRIACTSQLCLSSYTGVCVPVPCCLWSLCFSAIVGWQWQVLFIRSPLHVRHMIVTVVKLCLMFACVSCLLYLSAGIVCNRVLLPIGKWLKPGQLSCSDTAQAAETSICSSRLRACKQHYAQPCCNTGWYNTQVHVTVGMGSPALYPSHVTPASQPTRLKVWIAPKHLALLQIVGQQLLLSFQLCAAVVAYQSKHERTALYIIHRDQVLLFADGTSIPCFSKPTPRITTQVLQYSTLELHSTSAGSKMARTTCCCTETAAMPQQQPKHRCGHDSRPQKYSWCYCYQIVTRDNAVCCARTCSHSCCGGRG